MVQANVYRGTILPASCCPQEFISIHLESSSRVQVHRFLAHSAVTDYSRWLQWDCVGMLTTSPLHLVLLSVTNGGTGGCFSHTTLLKQLLHQVNKKVFICSPWPVTAPCRLWASRVMSSNLILLSLVSHLRPLVGTSQGLWIVKKWFTLDLFIHELARIQLSVWMFTSPFFVAMACASIWLCDNNRLV